MSQQIILPPGMTPEHAPLVYTPGFWNPAKAYRIDWTPDPEAAYREGYAYRQTHNLRLAAELQDQGIRNSFVWIDLQNGFHDQGELPVQGTAQVVLRAAVRGINGSVQDWYTDGYTSYDTHPEFHISWASRWWHSTNGDVFDLREHKAAVLDLVDRARGVFKATGFEADGTPVDLGHIQSMFNQKDVVAYWDHLQATGQGPIWVFNRHCQIGTPGANLHPLLVEVLAFMAGARMLEVTPIFKGHLRDTDWFGAFRPCRDDPSHPQGGLQKGVIDRFKGNNCNEVFGVAEDFCRHYTIEQAMDHLADTSDIDRLVFVSDGTAPIVPNAPRVIELYERARQHGVRFIKHDSPMDNPFGPTRGH